MTFAFTYHVEKLKPELQSRTRTNPILYIRDYQNPLIVVIRFRSRSAALEAFLAAYLPLMLGIMLMGSLYLALLLCYRVTATLMRYSSCSSNLAQSECLRVYSLMNRFDFNFLIYLRLPTFALRVIEFLT
jgi:hypothetical protein